jgi:hypothetical protein
MMKKTLLMTFLMIVAIVLGGLIGQTCDGTQIFGWLAYSKEFSFNPGTFINIDVFSLTFGFTFRVNVAQLILAFAGIFTYYKIAPKIFAV